MSIFFLIYIYVCVCVWMHRFTASIREIFKIHSIKCQMVSYGPKEKLRSRENLSHRNLPEGILISIFSSCKLK